MTNKDKLMDMSNAELAYFIRYRENCECCSFEFGDYGCISNICRKGIERWLESECDKQ